MLITGPTGSGKTSAVFACAKQLGYDVIEIHAGQIRNKTKILQMFGEATQSHRLPTTQQQQQGFGQKISKEKKRMFWIACGFKNYIL